MSLAGTKDLRILCLQHSSIFEAFGGVEYYLDDFLKIASSMLGEKSVHTVTAARTDKFSLAPRPYGVSRVNFRKNKLLQKIENRFSWALAHETIRVAKGMKPDFLVSSHVSMGPVTYFCSKVLGIPYVTLVYGIECWDNLFPQDEWCLKKSASILSISHWTKDILVKRGYDAERIGIFHPALAPDFESVRPSRIDIETKKPLRLLSISRLDAREQYKGQDHVLKALASLKESHPSLKFDYVIQGEGSDRERLEKLVAEYRLGSEVAFRPSVKNREELVRCYQNTDVFIMPSRYGKWSGKWRGEGFGIVYVEAAAFEVPSIAYACGGVMDIIADGENGILVSNDNIEGLAHALKDLNQNREKVIRLGKRAKEMALERFTYSAVGRELQHYFAELENLSKSISKVTPDADSVNVPGRL